MHKRVLKKPSPYVIFAKFGDSSLDFELRCYTADIMNGLSLASDLRSEIYRRFNAAGIEIAFPQRVVHMINETTVAKYQRRDKKK